MPLLRNAKKALRVSKRKTEINQTTKSRMKTMLDAVKAKPSNDTISNAYSAIDRAVKKHLLHKNKAARLKSQVSRLANVNK